MRRLVYWVAVCKNDSPAYSIRAKTRKACYEALRKWGADDEWSRHYAKPAKVAVEYDNVFDLVDQALNEGGIEGRVLDSVRLAEADALRVRDEDA